MDPRIESIWDDRSDIERRYKSNPDIRIAVEDIRRTAQALGGRTTDWERLAGRKVLDLACGSRETPRVDRVLGYPPFYSLFCARAGAEVWGVDLYRCSVMDMDIYNHVQANLVQVVLGDGLSSIPEIATVRFDIVHSQRFAYNLPPSVIDDLRRRGVSTKLFVDRIREQSVGLLKDGGWLIFENGDYKKE